MTEGASEACASVTRGRKCWRCRVSHPIRSTAQHSWGHMVFQPLLTLDHHTNCPKPLRLRWTRPRLNAVDRVKRRSLPRFRGDLLAPTCTARTLGERQFMLLRCSASHGNGPCHILRAAAFIGASAVPGNSAARPNNLSFFRVVRNLRAKGTQKAVQTNRRT